MGPQYVEKLFDRETFKGYVESTMQEIDQKLREMGRGILKAEAGTLSVELAKEHHFRVAQLGRTEAKVDGNRVKYMIYFDGANGEFFRYQPSKTSGNPPQASVISNGMAMYYDKLKADLAAIKAEFQNDFANLERWTKHLQEDAAAFNNDLQGNILTSIKKRIATVLAEADEEKQLNL